MRRQCGYRHRLFGPFAGMFWIVFGLAFAFVPQFRWIMTDVFRWIGDAFRVLFVGHY